VSRVYFLSDFGNRDVYAGVVRALVERQSRLVDLAHDLPPGDVAHASFQLYAAAPHLEPGAVVLAVVDPGVGGSRRALAVRGRKLWYVVPDNGLLSLVREFDPPLRAWALEPERYTAGPPSYTFHGRDVFGPAAALLASGFPAAGLGREIDPASIVYHGPKTTGGAVGEVLTFDRFGNAITNLRPESPPRAVVAGSKKIPVARAFSDVPPGEALAYIGSSGLLEIAVNRGSAREALGLREGDRVRLEP